MTSPLTTFLDEIERVAGGLSGIKWKDEEDWRHDHYVGVRLHRDEDIEDLMCKHIALMNPTATLKLVRLVRELIKQRDGEARVAGYLFSGTVEERIQRDNADLEAILKEET